jgi:hypothetical protein
MGLHWTLTSIWKASLYFILTFELIKIGLKQEKVIFYKAVGEKLRQANNN